MGRRTVIILLAVTLTAAVAFRYLFDHSEEGPAEFRRRTPVLGTYATYIVLADSAEAPLIMASMDSLARYLDDELGVYGTGELAMMNSAGYGLMEEMSDDMRQVLETSLLIASVTDSLFDPAMGSLVSLWGFPHRPSLPDSASIDSVLAFSGLKCLSISGDTLRLSPGTLLDLGAVAKGYVSDRVFQRAMDLGASAALVEIGGEIRCGGNPDAERVWRLAVRDPRGEVIMEVMEMDSGAMATSGDYESFFVQDGRRYCHILDPRTGYPESRVASVTVVARRASIADALATAISVGGVPLAQTLPDSLFDIIIVITDDNGETTEWRRESE